MKLHRSLFFILTILFFGQLWCQEIEKKSVVIPKIQKHWHAFSLNEVRLQKGSPFYHAMENDEDYLKGMDVNRMLNRFLSKAGLSELQGQYPGSDQPKNTRPGYLDHYLSAISLMYAQTGDPEYKKRVTDIVGTLTRVKKALTKKGKTNQLLYDLKTLAKLKKLQRGEIMLAGPDETGYPWGGMGNIWYGVHKMLAGLRDAYLYTNDRQAFDLWKNEADFITDFALKTNPDLFDDMLDIEHGGMNEVFADLYAVTGKQRYMKVSMKFNHQKVILNTALANNVLYGRHVNMQVPTFVGTARQYELTGNSVSKKATLNFLSQMYQSENNAIGGSGRYERYLPAGKTSKALGFTSDETCATYNMLKVSLQAFEFTGDFQYMNYYEKALYNHILASQDPETGGMTYYVSMMPGGFKSFSDGYNLGGIWCCVGTGMENHAKYGRAIYFHNSEGILVNLFIPSVLKAKTEGIQLSLHTKFPEKNTIRITVDKSDHFQKNIALRYPSWVDKGAKVWINNKRISITTKPGGKISLKHDWKTGDEIKVEFPQHFSFETASDNPHLKALMHGPIVMAAELGKEKLPGSQLVKKAMHYNNWITPQLDIPILVEKKEIQNNLKPQGKPLHYTLSNSAILDNKTVPVTFKPFYEMNKQRYAVYLKSFSEKEWEKRKEVVSDEVNPSNNANEKEHHLAGDKTDTIRFKDHRHYWENNRYGREAKPGGEFSYKLRVKSAKQQFLTVTYWGSASKNRALDIYVDDQLLTSERLTEKQPISYYEKDYLIPNKFIKAKKEIKITFKAKENSAGGAIYGLKLSSDPKAFPGYSFY